MWRQMTGWRARAAWEWDGARASISLEPSTAFAGQVRYLAEVLALLRRTRARVRVAAARVREHHSSWAASGRQRKKLNCHYSSPAPTQVVTVIAAAPSLPAPSWRALGTPGPLACQLPLDSRPLWRWRNRRARRVRPIPLLHGQN